MKLFRSILIPRTGQGRWEQVSNCNTPATDADIEGIRDGASEVYDSNKKPIECQSAYWDLRLIAKIDDLRTQLLATAAENVRMREALKACIGANGCAPLPGYIVVRVAKLLSSTPTALVGAIEGMREVLIRNCKCDKRREYTSEGHPNISLENCAFCATASAYDDALKGSK